MDYEVYMHIALLDSVPKSGVQRRKVLDFIYSLRKYPGTLGDFIDKDVSSRERQIKIIGDYAVTFWLDSPVKIIMVVKVCLADR